MLSRNVVQTKTPASASTSSTDTSLERKLINYSCRTINNQPVTAASSSSAAAIHAICRSRGTPFRSLCSCLYTALHLMPSGADRGSPHSTLIAYPVQLTSVTHPSALPSFIWGSPIIRSGCIHQFPSLIRPLPQFSGQNVERLLKPVEERRIVQHPPPPHFRSCPHSTCSTSRRAYERNTPEFPPRRALS